MAANLLQNGAFLQQIFCQRKFQFGDELRLKELLWIKWRYIQLIVNKTKLKYFTGALKHKIFQAVKNTSFFNERQIFITIF